MKNFLIKNKKKIQKLDIIDQQIENLKLKKENLAHSIIKDKIELKNYMKNLLREEQQNRKIQHFGFTVENNLRLLENEHTFRNNFITSRNSNTKVFKVLKPHGIFGVRNNKFSNPIYEDYEFPPCSYTSLSFNPSQDLLFNKNIQKDFNNNDENNTFYNFALGNSNRFIKSKYEHNENNITNSMYDINKVSLQSMLSEESKNCITSEAVSYYSSSELSLEETTNLGFLNAVEVKCFSFAEEADKYYKSIFESKRNKHVGSYVFSMSKLNKLKISASREIYLAFKLRTVKVMVFKDIINLKVKDLSKIGFKYFDEEKEEHFTALRDELLGFVSEKKLKSNDYIIYSHEKIRNTKVLTNRLIRSIKKHMAQ